MPSDRRGISGSNALSRDFAEELRFLETARSSIVVTGRIRRFSEHFTAGIPGSIETLRGFLQWEPLFTDTLPGHTIFVKLL